MFQQLPNSSKVVEAASDLKLQGFCVLEHIFSDAFTYAVLAQRESLISQWTPSSRFNILRDRFGFPSVMNKVDNVDDFLFDSARDPTLVRLVSALVGKGVIPLHTEFFSKAALGSEVSPPHQDQIFYEDHFNDETAVAVWIALTDVHANGGPLEFAAPVAKSLLPHGRSVGSNFDFQLVDSLSGQFSYASVPLLRGSCVIHNSYVVHRSAPNTSGVARHAVAFNYRGSPLMEKRDWLLA